MAWKDLPAKPNILIIITDQQRALQHWPADWIAKNLPAMQRLVSNGMSFKNAFSSACECSPSRASFVTSTYDNTNKIRTTGPNQNLPLPPAQGPLPNLATVLAAAGYQVVWKGKWHLYQVANTPKTDSLVPYGFSCWNPPDAGITLDTTLLGGGTPGTSAQNGNDARYVSGPGGAIDFLQAYDGSSPFCLIVSLVNPHDVHVYTQDWASVGFPATIPEMGVGLPDNADDPLTEKPRAQALFRDQFDLARPIGPAEGTSRAGYVNFYAWLHTLVDEQIGALLDVLDEQNLTNSTVIVRMGDHGEMGMSHGLREKMYVAYDEAIHVPFIVANPLAFPEPVETEALASLLDLVPTLASIAGAQVPAGLAGKDLTPVLRDPARSVQEGVLYSYDDSAGVTGVATQIRALRKRDWMYSVYFLAGSSSIPLEFELYDLRQDPGQMVNLLSIERFKPEILPVWRTLNSEIWKLADQLGSTPPGFTPPPSDALDRALLEKALEPVPLEKAGTLVLDGK
jgi:choline-sulfatase